MTALAKSFFMITPTVKENHLKFKQTSDNTWLMYVPATYPCCMSGGTVGFKFMVSDEEGHLYMPAASGSTKINGDLGSNTGWLVKSSSTRVNIWAQLPNNWLEVKKDGASQVSKPEDIVMDGCLVFEITLRADGNLTYKATLDDTRRVSYAACNTTMSNDGYAYGEAKYTTFLFASKMSDGTFSPYYKGKVVVDKIPSENYNQIKHNGFYFYTPIYQKYEDADAAGNKNDWWAEVKNDLGTRGISKDGKNLFENGGNFESPIYGSFNISTTFYYGKNTQGKMEKTLDDAYDDPLVGCIRTYCNEDKDMESRYNVKVFLVTGYSEEDDAFRVTEIPYIPKGVGVLLYTTDATVDILGPEKEWKGETFSNIEETFGKNYLVPTFSPTNVSTFSTDKAGNKYMNFFLAKLFSAKDYELYKDKYGTDNHWGFFSVLNTQTSKANRAYLQFPYKDLFDGFSHFPERDPKGAQGAKLALGTFDDDNTTTGIKNVSGKQDRKVDNAYYTLDGRKVEKPAHGLFIHNGKTYLFK